MSKKGVIARRAQPDAMTVLSKMQYFDSLKSPGLSEPGDTFAISAWTPIPRCPCIIVSKKSEFQTVGDGAHDVPAVKSCVIWMFSANSQHFSAGRPWGRPLHIRFFDSLLKGHLIRGPYIQNFPTAPPAGRRRRRWRCPPAASAPGSACPCARAGGAGRWA